MNNHQQILHQPQHSHSHPHSHPHPLPSPPAPQQLNGFSGGSIHSRGNINNNNNMNNNSVNNSSNSSYNGRTLSYPRSSSHQQRHSQSSQLQATNMAVDTDHDQYSSASQPRQFRGQYGGSSASPSHPHYRYSSEGQLQEHQVARDGDGGGRRGSDGRQVHGYKEGFGQSRSLSPQYHPSEQDQSQQRPHEPHQFLQYNREHPQHPQHQQQTLSPQVYMQQRSHSAVHINQSSNTGFGAGGKRTSADGANRAQSPLNNSNNYNQGNPGSRSFHTLPRYPPSPVGGVPSEHEPWHQQQQHSEQGKATDVSRNGQSQSQSQSQSHLGQHGQHGQGQSGPPSSFHSHQHQSSPNQSHPTSPQQSRQLHHLPPPPPIESNSRQGSPAESPPSAPVTSLASSSSAILASSVPWNRSSLRNEISSGSRSPANETRGDAMQTMSTGREGPWSRARPSSPPLNRPSSSASFTQSTSSMPPASNPSGPYSYEQQPSSRPWGPGSYHQHYQNNPDETGSTSASETSQRRLSSQSAHTDEGQETSSGKGHLPSSSSSSAVTSRDYQGTGPPYHQQQQPTHFEPGYRLGRTSAPSLLAAGGAQESNAEQPLSPSGPGGPILSNKRRSLADLLFVPIKSKEKRNSNASSASSVESYRPEENGPDHQWIQTPKAGPKKLELEQSPPSSRKPTKGGKGMGSAGSSPKTFQCTGYPGCNMVFTRSEHLARHERKHTGEKPYRCIVANCPRVFSRYDNMIQHTQTHSDRSKRDSLVPGSSGPSRSSSVQSTPLISDRARGGSSPVVFGPGYDDHRYSQHNSPGLVHSPAFGQQSQQHYYPYQTQQHPMQWTLPSGAPASSPSLLASRGSISHLPGREGGDSPQQQQLQQQQYQGAPNPARTLKANSRSLPHLQPRDSPGGNVGDSPSLALQHGMSSMEIEEIKRRKSEILLPSTVSAARAATLYNRGQVGLGVTPFTSSTAHPGSLPQVEKLSQQEQARLNEHRRSAQAIMLKMNASTGSIDSRPPPQSDQDPNGKPQGGSHRPSSIGLPLTHVKHLSAQEKDRLLEHRRSTPELMYDTNLKRSSNDDTAVQPLPSRDVRSGMQWFSQVNPSPQPTGGSSTQFNASPDQTPTVLPPLLGNYNLADQPRTRNHSSHIHPLSRHGSLSTPQDPKAPQAHRSIDSFLPLSKENQYQQQYAPILKSQVVDAIERMDPTHFDDLKAKATITFANEHVRNPLFLGNVVAILSVVVPPSGSVLGKRKSDPAVVPLKTQNDMDVDEVELEKEQRDGMELDSDTNEDAFANIKAEPAGDASMPRKYEETNIAATVTVSPPLDRSTCRYALDIDVDSFRRDPGPVLRSLNDLTVSTRQTILSFVSGFEPSTIGNESERELGHDEEEKDSGQEKSPLASRQSTSSKSTGYPSHHVRLGRFYMPEHTYPVQGAIVLARSLGPEDLWRTCEFKEYPGVSIWVPERALARYQELVAEFGNKMALTLVHPQEQISPTLSTTIKRENANGSTGSRQAPHRSNSDVSDKSASSDGSKSSDSSAKSLVQDQDTALVPESMLHREMIAEVWADMYRQYIEHQQQVQLQQRQEQQQAPQPQHQYFQPPPASSQNRVATFEEHQRSLSMEQQLRESSHGHHSQAQEHYRHHPYPAHYPQRHHPYAPYGSDHPHERHQYPHEQHLMQEPHVQMLRRSSGHDEEEEMSEELRHRVLDRRGVLDRAHRHDRPQYEDDDDDDEDRETNDNDDEDEEGEEGERRRTVRSLRAPPSSSSSTSTSHPPLPRDANMLRRISIAELCNPMRSLATERQRQP